MTPPAKKKVKLSIPKSKAASKKVSSEKVDQVAAQSDLISKDSEDKKEPLLEKQDDSTEKKMLGMRLYTHEHQFFTEFAQAVKDEMPAHKKLSLNDVWRALAYQLGDIKPEKVVKTIREQMI